MLAIGVLSACAALLLSALALGAAVVAGHRAAAAADLAALAAATQILAGAESTACAAAEALAAANGAVLTTCRVEGGSALVEVSTPVAGGLPGLPPAVGRSRAGPPGG